MKQKRKKPRLTVPRLRKKAAAFAKVESTHAEPAIYGITDGKAIGTYFEHKFKAYLHRSKQTKSQKRF